MRLCGHQFGGWMDPPCETGYQGWLQLEKKWAWRCWRVKLMNYKLINLFVLLKKGLICLIPQGCSMDDLGSRNLWSSSKVGRPQTRKWTLQPEHIGDALLDGWVLKNTSQLTLFVCLVPLRFFLVWPCWGDESLLPTYLMKHSKVTIDMVALRQFRTQICWRVIWYSYRIAKIAKSFSVLYFV